jgi:hypothetical protein
MKHKLIIVVVGTAFAASACSAFAGEKVHVTKVITKADVEKILGVPVKDPKGRNKEGTDGFYESDWSYRIHGLPATAALEQEKAVATKILAHL